MDDELVKWIERFTREASELIAALSAAATVTPPADSRRVYCSSHLYGDHPLRDDCVEPYIAGAVPQAGAHTPEPPACKWCGNLMMDSTVDWWCGSCMKYKRDELNVQPMYTAEWTYHGPAFAAPPEPAPTVTPAAVREAIAEIDADYEVTDSDYDAWRIVAAAAEAWAAQQQSGQAGGAG